jgi:hypothetical protein
MFAEEIIKNQKRKCLIAGSHGNTSNNTHESNDLVVVGSSTLRIQNHNGSRVNVQMKV